MVLAFTRALMTKKLYAKILSLYQKHRELVTYGFFGGLTTLISFLSFVVFDALNLGTFWSVTLSWFMAVSFAYFTNRKWVFISRAKGAKILKEAASFFALRGGTYFLDLGVVWLFIEVLLFNSQMERYAVRLGSNILVIIVNFLASKFVVFRKSKR